MRKLSLAVFGLLLASNVQANNLVNGNFETGDFTGWTVSGTANVCPGSDSFCGISFDGVFSANLNAGDHTADALISQTFATTPGVTYDFSFAYGIMDFVGGKSQQLQAEIISNFGGAHDLLNQTVTSPASVPPGDAVNADVNYQLFSFQFTADDTSTTLLFTDLPSNDTGSVDGKLDTASIDPTVPEPGSLLLLATGFVPLLLRLKRRSSK
jgi:hypothetical protein